MGVSRSGYPGSGYAVGGRLVLTSAHVAARSGERVEVFRPGGDSALGGVVVWCGTPGGRDDAALVLVDDDPHWRAPVGAVRWGRMVTDRPGTGCETWGVPDVAQRSGDDPAAGRAVEATQLEGRVNPGSGFAGNQYVMDLLQHPPQWSLPGTSPWGGLSGAAMFCDRLLAGVVASDRAHSAHGQLNVVPAYVLHHDPAFRAALAEHGAAPAGLEGVEFQDLADPAVTAPPGGLRSPAALLQSGRQTVPFHGREDLLERLQAWCVSGGFGAWLLHGAGGQGKTRLAHHLAQLLATDRWAVLWPRADATAAELREVRHASKPLLILLDYAENRTAQLTALTEAAADHPGTTALKILLLARTDGDWWTRAKTATSLAQDYLDTAPAYLLPPLEADPAHRPESYRVAARALAAALPDVHGLAEYDWQAAAATLPLPRLEQDGYGNALTLHMTALADLLDTTTPVSAGPGAGGAAGQEAWEVEDRLLGHEHRYWHRSAIARGLTPHLSLGTLEGALAAAHLTGAPDRRQADDTWRRLPSLADQTRDRRDAVTAWIGDLYPATAPDRPWGALQPDRLAERHIGRVLDTDPDLADHLLDGADDAQKEQLLTVYSRAAAHRVFGHRLDTRLTDLCLRHHPRLTDQIITTAVKSGHPAPLIAALDTLTTDLTTTPDDLDGLRARFPRSSRRLAGTAVRLARTIAGRHRELAQADPGTYLPNFAMAINDLSVRLREAGRWEEALAAVQEAVGHYRTLTQANPDTYLPNLATSVNNLSSLLGEVGRRDEALAAIQEAIRISRALAEADSDAYLPDLAMSLSNLSLRLGEAGRRDEALAAVQEAAGHYHVLAQAKPAHLPRFAMSLNTLSVRLGEVGRREEALAVIQEAIRISRALAEADSDAYLPDLAMSLNTLSNRLDEVGRREEALAAVQEAASHYRTLAEANPDAYLPNLATSLNTLSNGLGEVGRWEEALAVIQEAIRIRRELAEANPDAYLPNLAMYLNNLAVRLGKVGQQEEALAAVQEAVSHYRTLAEANPDAHFPDLAISLNTLSNGLGEVGRWEEALAVIQEAIRIRRELAEANPDAYLPNLATSLNTLSVRLGEVGRRDEALAAIQEAIRIRRRLAEAYPKRFQSDLKQSLEVATWLEALPQ
ncbi:tetratricopeptide repeat protein [Streptomyces sp. NPDC002055]|uniref:tetratricopeptide repeat protein n=1 Tax=Streptomyces sp. NPDC002055 TaxID=3154534 RepID=UPI00331A7367